MATCFKSIFIYIVQLRHSKMKLCINFHNFIRTFSLGKSWSSWTDEGTEWFYSSENVPTYRYLRHERHFSLSSPPFPLDLFRHWNLNGYLYLPNNNDNDFIRFEKFILFDELSRGKTLYFFRTFENIFPRWRLCCLMKRKTFMRVSIRDRWMKCLSSNLFYLYFLSFSDSNTFCVVFLYVSLCAPEMTWICFHASLFEWKRRKMKLYFYGGEKK